MEELRSLRRPRAGSLPTGGIELSRRDPHSYADLDQGRVTALDLNLVVDFDSSRIKGRV